MHVLITGVAGFIGFHMAQRLLAQGFSVTGIDNLNDYYSVELKHARLQQLRPYSQFRFHYLDLADRTGMAALFENNRFDRVIHLAAQAGVRYSLENPMAYVDSNLTGFMTLLEGCRRAKVGHLLFASSSSVYGANRKTPFAVEDRVDHPVSLYAATKKANELLAHSYSHLYQLPMTGLRFFTVYGPWGRPDMAYFKFVHAIEQGHPIDVYNYGQMQRDFTYIDDIIEAMERLLPRIPQPGSTSGSDAPYKLYNIGNHSPVALGEFITVIESTLGKRALQNLLPMQPGDVPATCADVTDLMADVDFKPLTRLTEGIQCFVSWYRTIYIPLTRSREAA
ncbi:MAG: NAD-dependent epimerase [Synechococcaceae cyanobacterium SM2_3_1]|nr:NAD-dependent epimerase [Synechococcaceae cyanobacterium SM2_3_1]